MPQITTTRPTGQIHNSNPVLAQGALPEEGADNAGVNRGQEGDTFHSDSQAPVSSNRGFSFGNAITNFFKGIISPITMIIQNPLAALPMIVAGAALAFFCPALVPLMLVGGGAFSLFELGKGITKAITASNAKEMEESFKDIGTGAIGAVLTLLGIRGTAAIAAEAKAASTALRAGATEVEAVQVGINAAKEAKSIGLLSAFRENFSMLSGNGLRAAKDSFKLRGVKKTMNINPDISSETKPVSNTIDSNSNSIFVDNLKPEPVKIDSILKLKVTNSKSGFKFIDVALESKIGKRLNIEEIKVIVNDLYNKEITRMAERLKISESKLRKILPEVDYCEKGLGKLVTCQGVGAAGIIPGRGLAYFINPGFIRSNSKLNNYISVLEEIGGVNKPSVEMANSWIKEIALNLVSHECKHLERTLFSLKHLRWREYSAANKQQAINTFGNEGIMSLKGLLRLESRIKAFFENHSGAARKIRGFETSSTQSQRSEALAIVQDRLGLMQANRGGMSDYLNCPEEVSARMYSMFRRLEVLNEEMQVVMRRMQTNSSNETNLLNQRVRLRIMERELQEECTGFLNPERIEARTQLEQIRALIAQISQSLGL